MMQVVLSIQAGLVLPSMLLRKLGSLNHFLDWITYGGPIIKSGDPVEQEKQLKYATLVANAIMLSNVADLTEVLSSMHAVTRSFLLPPTRSGCRRSRYSGNLTGNSNRGLFGAHASPFFSRRPITEPGRD
jgi:hypothetical protein